MTQSCKNYSEISVERYPTHAMIGWRGRRNGMMGIELDNGEQDWPDVLLQHHACERLGIPTEEARDIPIIDCR